MGMGSMAAVLVLACDATSEGAAVKWLLVTYLLSGSCHADGPTPWWLNGDGFSFCPGRTILSLDSARFESEEDCEAEARKRWSESGYQTASRCEKTP